MNDTTWIAQSQEDLKQILNTAASFYTLTNIKINPSKSNLITNNLKDNPTIKFNGEVINNIYKNTAFRFLGCWFTASLNHKPVHNIIIREITSATKHLTFAKITAKQAVYIINNVILSRLAYRLQNTYLPTKTADKLTLQYTALVKQKAGLAKSVPNSALYHHRIYGLKKILDIQTTQHINALQKATLHPDFNHSILKIQLQNLQNAVTTNDSILMVLPIFPTPESLTTTAKIIITMLSKDFQLTNLSNPWPKPLFESGTSVNHILKNVNNANNIKKKLNIHHIHFIEQILDTNCDNFLDWIAIHHTTQKIARGKKPKCFETIKNLLSESEHPTLNLVIPNPFTIQPLNNSSK